MSSITSRLYTLIERGKQGDNRGLSVGFDTLDKYTFGLLRKELLLIGADSGEIREFFIKNLEIKIHNDYLCIQILQLII